MARDDHVEDLLKEVSERNLEKTAMKNTFRGVVKIPANILEGLFLAPTAQRKLTDDKDKKISEFYAGITVFSSTFGNIAALFGHMGLIDYNPRIGIPLFATHLSTNIASGIYEKYRKEKRRLQENS